jgi:hypothetical protein
VNNSAIFNSDLILQNSKYDVSGSNKCIREPKNDKNSKIIIKEAIIEEVCETEETSNIAQTPSTDKRGGSVSKDDSFFNQDEGINVSNLELETNDLDAILQNAISAEIEGSKFTHKTIFYSTNSNGSNDFGVCWEGYESWVLEPKNEGDANNNNSDTE